MTTFSLDENSATYQIRSYKPGELEVNDKIFTRSIIVAADQLIENWSPQTIAELTSESLALIIPFKPDILLIGTGAKLIFPRAEIYGELINHGIGIEVMHTAAACRTYNALTAENRHVMAALIIR